MKLPENAGAYVWGAGIGIIATAIVGFTWGGWVTGGTSVKNAATAASDARAAALAPYCLDALKADPQNLAKVKAGSSWDRANMIEKLGFATPAGAKLPDSEMARECAKRVVE